METTKFLGLIIDSNLKLGEEKMQYIIPKGSSPLLPG
jgi:hypothetical protein